MTLRRAITVLTLILVLSTLLGAVVLPHGALLYTPHDWRTAIATPGYQIGAAFGLVVDVMGVALWLVLSAVRTVRQRLCFRGSK